MILQADDERKAEAKKKEDSWQLMSESAKFLRDNADRWRERRIEECEGVRREEKEDRLTIVKMKKKRYGLAKLSKEENKRLKQRTEEKVMLAKAKVQRRKRGG